MFTRTIHNILHDRTCYEFIDKKVTQDLLVKIYNLSKLGPTSGNSSPLRMVFIMSQAEKEKLYTLQSVFAVNVFKRV